MPSKKCPKCNSLWGERDYFCGLCGARLVVIREEAEEVVEEKPDSAPRLALMWILETFPGLVQIKVVLASIAIFVLALVSFALAFFMLGFQVYVTACFIGAGGVILYWTGLSWIMYGYVCSPIEAMTEFQSRHWIVLVMATVIPATVFLFLAKLAADARMAGAG